MEGEGVILSRLQGLVFRNFPPHLGRSLGKEFASRSKEKAMSASRLSENRRPARFAFFWPSLRLFKYSGTKRVSLPQLYEGDNQV